MLTKKLLLAGIAAGALFGAASAASAATLSYRETGGDGLAGPDIDLSDVTPTGGTYRYAEEAASSLSATGNTFALQDVLSPGSSLPSGNVVVRLTLTNATFGSIVPSNALSGGAGCATFTSAVSLGGAANASQVSFVVSNSSPGCGSFNIDLPVRPNGVGNVTLTSEITTETGIPIDGGPHSLALVTLVNGIYPVVNAAIGGGALGNTIADLQTTPAPYLAFDVGPGNHTTAPESAQVGQLGTVGINVRPDVYRNLQKTLLTLADVTSTTGTTLTGDFTAYNGTGGFIAINGAFATSAPDGTNATASFGANPLATAIAFEPTPATPGITAGAPQPVQVRIENSGVVQSSSYLINIQYALSAGLTETNPSLPATRTLEPIEREGTNVILPWMNSADLIAANPNAQRNLVRIGNLVNRPAQVFAQLRSSTAGVTLGFAPVGVLPANGELVVDYPQLAALGNFGRGEVELIIEAQPADVTVRRYAINASGAFTEIESGTVANDQNAVVGSFDAFGNIVTQPQK